ncbi:MAG: glycosyltransferase family 4 protein [Actinomycetota bacterium]|nr:glycosyltransferase family 4 protein [Actinomycetota bacterium]
MTDRLRVAMTFEQCWHRVPGGTAVATLGVAGALARRAGIELIGVAARHRATAPEAWRPPVPVRHLPLPRLALYESWHRLRAPAVERATGRVDVIHATSMPVPPRSAPVVLTIHDLAFLRNAAHFTRRGNSFFRRGLELALKDADLVLCPSRTTIADCMNAGFDESVLRLVPHGVELHAVTEPEVERVRARHNLARPYVLWTGTVEPRKNLPGLLKAWSSLESEADLVLVGPRGWNEDLDDLVGSARERIKVLGFLPQTDLAPIYAGAAVFCYPSFTEGFGLPVLEAMTQGTPVVTSSGTSTEEIGEGAALLVDPTDPSSIAEAIGRVLGDAHLASELARQGRARAATYSWDNSAQLTLAAYREVAWQK